MKQILKDNLNGKYERMILKSFIRKNFEIVKSIFSPEHRFDDYSFYSDKGDIQRNPHLRSQDAEDNWFECYRKRNRNRKYKIVLYFNLKYARDIIKEIEKEKQNV
jgi:hypothetical protein